MDWIILVEWSARLILMALIGLSVWSISIIIERKKYFENWNGLISLDQLIESLKQNKNVEDLTQTDPRVQYLLKTGGVPREQLDNYFVAFINESQKTWKKGLSVLGTLGSTTPFIGLLGTILGIIVSFGELSKGAGDMKGVMFSLAEALILTAVGLAVAIPAVIAFNIFNKKVNSMIKDIESVKEMKKTI